MGFRALGLLDFAGFGFWGFWVEGLGPLPPAVTSQRATQPDSGSHWRKLRNCAKCSLVAKLRTWVTYSPNSTYATHSLSTASVHTGYLLQPSHRPLSPRFLSSTSNASRFRILSLRCCLSNLAQNVIPFSPSGPLAPSVLSLGQPQITQCESFCLVALPPPFSLCSRHPPLHRPRSFFLFSSSSQTLSQRLCPVPSPCFRLLRLISDPGKKKALLIGCWPRWKHLRGSGRSFRLKRQRLCF